MLFIIVNATFRKLFLAASKAKLKNKKRIGIKNKVIMKKKSVNLLRRMKV